ncbi:MAG: hypothetical protein IPO48_14920 [Saprospiraceae bacterium]|nr:hypothetical protein [Saprospiraceae bacterium]
MHIWQGRNFRDHSNHGIICQGEKATLTASGGGTGVWSNGATTAGITTGNSWKIAK